jgi:hypothetical protein
MERKIVLAVAPNFKMNEVALPLVTSFGLTVLTCKNTTEAIKVLKHERIDLITASAFMDDDVFGLIKAVRALPRQLQKPIWIFAGEPGRVGRRVAPQIAMVAQLLGADRFEVVQFADIPRVLAEIRAALDDPPERWDH